MAESVEQNSWGDGDNVAGNKLVFSSVSPEAFETNIEKVVTCIRHRNLTQASSLLDTLLSTSNLDSDATKTLEVLNLFILVEKNEAPDSAYNTLNIYLNRDLSSVFKDIAHAVLIRLDVKEQCIAVAKERFHQIKLPGQNANEAYLTLVADVNEINAKFEDSKLGLTEAVGCALVRGATRLMHHKLALSIAEHLNKFAPSFNSRVLLFSCKLNVTYDEVDGRHYWITSAKVHAKLNELCNELSHLVDESRGREARTIDFAYGLLRYVNFECRQLVDVCYKYASEIENNYTDFYNLLMRLYDNQVEQTDNLLEKLTKSNKDPSYKVSLLAEITGSQNISSENSFLLTRLGDRDLIRKWFESGGKVESENPMEAYLAELELKAFSSTNDTKQIQYIRSEVDGFIQKFNSDLVKLNPQRLVELCTYLIDLGLPSGAVDLLRPLIPSENIWLSPLVCCYIDALLKSEQLRTLRTILDSINKTDWDCYLWQIESYQFALQHQLPEAVSALEKAIKLYSFSAELWLKLINLSRQVEQDNFNSSKILKRIPKEVLESPSPSGYELLKELIAAGEQLTAEMILVTWFINDPTGTARDVSQFGLSICSKRELKLNPSPQLEICRGGVVYEVDGKQELKVLVEPFISSHSHLLDCTSPLAQHLMSMEVNEENTFGMLDIKLLEILPPYIAILRLATQLRVINNDGSDCFYSLNVPSEPEQLIPFLERKLGALKKEGEDVLQNINIPIYCKGRRVGASNPIAAALKLFTDKNIAKQSVPNFGDEHADSVILDAYSFCYLALADLAYDFTELINNVYITRETANCIEYWFKEINQEDYLSIGVMPEGGLFRTTAENIRNNTVDLQRALSHLFESSKVLAPNLVDFPPHISLIDGLTDLSTESSYKLAIANDIPWFCLDPLLARLVEQVDGRVVNIFACISSLTDTIVADLPKGIKLHVFTAFPYPITYRDLIGLSRSKNELAHYILSELIKQYAGSFSSYDEALNYTYLFVIHALVCEYQSGEVLNGPRGVNPRNNGYFERLFNICCHEVMQYDDNNKEAEYKLAKLLSLLLYRVKGIESAMKLFHYLAYQFISGHFLKLERVNEHLRTLSEQIENG